MANDPSVVSSDVSYMREFWDVIEPLMQGTRAMREAGVALMPRFPKEDEEDYNCRLKVSTLLPVYSETIGNLTGRVFADSITVNEDVLPEISELLEDIDRQGNNLDIWAEQFFRTGLSHGINFAFVDFPAVEGLKTKAQEKAAGVRPYVATILPRQYLGCKTKEVNGSITLTQFRFMESVSIEDAENQFNTKQVNQVRVLEVGSWSTYRRTKQANGREEWTLHDKGTTTLRIIPIVPFYTGREGFMRARPKLTDLAYLNIKHWQSQSDQDNILHVARVPLLAFIGVDNPAATPGANEFTVGTSAGSYIPMGGDMKYVEHTGAAIEAGRNSLKDLVEEMFQSGAKLLQKEKGSTKTVFQANEESAQELSPLQSMACMLEDCIDQILYIFALWLGQKEGGSVKVNGNFDVDFAPETSMPYLKSLVDAGYLSEETLFAETKRRGIISDEVDWQEEQERINAQGPRLGMIGINQPPVDNDLNADG